MDRHSQDVEDEQLGSLNTEDINRNHIITLPTLVIDPVQRDPMTPAPSSTGSSRRVSLGSPSVMVMPPAQSFPGFIRRTDNNHMDAEGIAQVVELLKEHDRNKVNNCNGDIDSLLILVALFSAIVAAFTIESYKTLSQDPATASAILLAQILLRLNGTEGLQASGFNVIPLRSEAATADVLVNTFWFLSLVCSIVTASIGIFTKQWTRDFININCSSPEEWLRVREVRHESLTHWKTFELVAFLPLLLQLALLLFLVGLVLFLQQNNPIVGWIVTVAVVIWVMALSFIILMPMASSTCPYQIAFLQSISQRSRRVVAHLRYGGGWRQRLGYENPFYRFPGDENGVKRERKLDLEAIIGADTSLKDNTVLEQSLSPCVRSFGPERSLEFICRIMADRLDRPITSINDIRFEDYSSVPSQVLDVVMHILVDKGDDLFSKENHLLTTLLPIEDTVSYKRSIEIVSAFYRLVDYTRKAKRTPYLYSWGRAMVLLHSGLLPRLYLNPPVSEYIPQPQLLEIETFGVDEFIRLSSERYRHNAELDERMFLSDVGAQRLVEALARKIRSNQFTDMEDLVSTATAIFGLLVHIDMTPDILRACSHQIHALAEVLRRTVEVFPSTFIENILQTAEEFNKRVPGLVDESFRVWLQNMLTRRN